MPKDNALCDWCDYQYLCPLRKHKVKPDKRKEEENIDKLVRDYIAAHKTISNIEPKIHKHFNKEKIERFYHKEGVISRTKNKKISIRKP